MRRPRRRTVLKTALGLSVATAGCNKQNRDPVRTLTARDLAIESESSVQTATLRVANQSSFRDERADFSGVRVHGFRSDEEVGATDVGDVTYHDDVNDGIPVSFECTSFPDLVTFSADQSPCDEDVRTVIDIATYSERDGWCIGCYTRDCGDGLPPDID